MLMPLVPDTSTPESPFAPQMMAIDLVMVSAPKPPGSRLLISPGAAVLEIAPAKVLHGAVRLNGLASSPPHDTQVRVACALAGMANSARQIALSSANTTDDFIFALPALNLYK